MVRLTSECPVRIFARVKVVDQQRTDNPAQQAADRFADLALPVANLIKCRSRLLSSRVGRLYRGAPHRRDDALHQGMTQRHPARKLHDGDAVHMRNARWASITRIACAGNHLRFVAGDTALEFIQAGSKT